MGNEEEPELAERRTAAGELIERLPRPEQAVRWGLEPHPEGGWYRRTGESRLRVTLADGRVRPAATLILFLLPPGESSAWHRVSSDEHWIWSGGGEIALQDGGDGDSPVDGEVTVLGDPVTGRTPQRLVAAGRWQRTLPSDVDALASCLVSPGFDFADFTMA